MFHREISHIYAGTPALPLFAQLLQLHVLRRFQTEQPMRIVLFVLMCLMTLFAIVQYNDPDGVMWMAIYAVPALWCATAIFKRSIFLSIHARTALVFCVLLTAAGVIRFWPLTPRFWSKDVWYNVETAREGMGLMVVAMVLVVLVIYQHKQRNSRHKR